MCISYRQLPLLLALLPLAGLAGERQPSHHPHEIEEEIVVTAPFGVTGTESATPIGVVSGDELLEKAAASLGETLQNEIGIWNASFGASVGHPVVRGQSGNRVQVLQNNLGVTDVANQSQDHAEGVETYLAERLEVIRGPATLLYGNGAVGGVINVIDRRIPESLSGQTEFLLEQTHNTLNSENRSLVRIRGEREGFALHADAFHREGDDIRIPGYAIDAEALETLEELREAAAGHDEEDEEHADEPLMRGGYGELPNSSTQAEGASIGFSRIGDRGFLGFSVSRLKNDYGLPPGVHAHEEEGHGHEEEEDEEEHEEEDEHGEEEVEFVRIALDKTRYDLRGRMSFERGFISQAEFALGYTDYEHREIEFLEDGDTFVGTRFANTGLEGRGTLKHDGPGDWTGVLGVQFSDTDFSAVGEEAFIPASDIRNLGIFLVERFTRQQLTLEFGARADRNRVESRACGSAETAFSLSGSLLYSVTDKADLVAGFSRSERTPSVEELFSNISTDTCARYADNDQLVLHAATALFEVGAPDLGKEVSGNFDLSFRYDGDRVRGELNAYHNAIRDYIFLQLTAEEQEEQGIAVYRAEDADFIGLEGMLAAQLWQADAARLELTLFGDLVRAELASGAQVPRIPPARFGGGLRLHGNDWTTRLQITRALDQRRTGALELPTDGYTLVSFHADYHWALGTRAELQLFFKVQNLLDERIRNHASLVKHYAPEPGRGFTLGFRFRY